MKKGLTVLLAISLGAVAVGFRIRQEREQLSATQGAPDEPAAAEPEPSPERAVIPEPPSKAVAAEGVVTAAKEVPSPPPPGSRNKAYDALRAADSRYRRALKGEDRSANLAAALKLVEAAIEILSAQPGEDDIRSLRRKAGVLRSDIIRVSGF